MHFGVSASIDSRLQRLVVARARRRLPVLRVVPDRWIRPMVKPTVIRLRRSLVRVSLAALLLVCVVLTLVVVTP
jgi:hypothetical protein